MSLYSDVLLDSDRTELMLVKDITPQSRPFGVAAVKTQKQPVIADKTMLKGSALLNIRSAKQDKKKFLEEQSEAAPVIVLEYFHFSFNGRILM